MKILAFKVSQVSLHMGVAFIVTYAFTGSITVGGLAAVVEPICNVTLMPLHDKLWARFRASRQGAEKRATADGGFRGVTVSG